jgi:hypothetical protein
MCTLYTLYNDAPCGIVSDTKRKNFQRRTATINTCHNNLTVKQSLGDSGTGDFPMVLAYPTPVKTCSGLSVLYWLKH